MGLMLRPMVNWFMLINNTDFEWHDFQDEIVEYVSHEVIKSFAGTFKHHFDIKRIVGQEPDLSVTVNIQVWLRFDGSNAIDAVCVYGTPLPGED